MAVPFDATQYFLAPAIQQSFLDKDTGELLANGQVYFYRDDSRNTRLDVFYLTGNYPTYTLTAFPYDVFGNVKITLSSIGTVIDPLGDPTEIYYHPYDENGQVVNYYIEVYDQFDVFQFSIQNFPGLGTSGTTGNEAENNYVGNGQFLLHNNILDPENGEGYISQNDTIIAPGGHHFVKAGTGGSQFVTFSRDTSSGAADYPRYSARFVQSGSITSSTRKDYVFRFPDVNTFANDDTYTFGIEARTNSGSADIIMFYNKDFGTGGSTAIYQAIDTKTITAGNTRYTVNVTFGDNSGQSIGDNDDDFIEIGVRFPLDSSYDIYITDVFLTKGSDLSDTYPVTTKQEDCWRALAGGFPFTNATAQEIYDGWLIGLPIYLSQSGFAADTSIIGRIESISHEITDFSSLPVVYADGSKYETDKSSSIGIPYARLQEKYWDDTLKVPLYGTGLDYITIVSPTSDENLVIFNNNFGAANSITATGTGFPTPVQIHDAVAAGYYCRVYKGGTNEFYIEGSEPRSVVVNTTPTMTNAKDAGGGNATGFTFDIIYSVNKASSANANALISLANRPLAKITTVVASSLTNTGSTGKYFEFETYDLGTTTVKQWYVWFFFTNETDPGGTGTGIKITLDSTDTADIVAQKIIYSLMGGEVTSVVAPAASAVTGSPYLTIQGAGSTDYYLWLNKDNGGTDPNLSGTGIEVNISTGDTATQVANKIIETSNGKFFAVPDLRGLILRGFDDGRGLDYDAADRYTYVPGIRGDKVGTYQIDRLMVHAHAVTYSGFTAGGSLEAYFTGANEETSAAGGSDNRPYNISVQYVIRL